MEFVFFEKVASKKKTKREDGRHAQLHDKQELTDLGSFCVTRVYCAVSVADGCS